MINLNDPDSVPGLPYVPRAKISWQVWVKRLLEWIISLPSNKRLDAIVATYDDMLTAYDLLQLDNSGLEFALTLVDAVSEAYFDIPLRFRCRQRSCNGCELCSRFAPWVAYYATDSREDANTRMCAFLFINIKGFMAGDAHHIGIYSVNAFGE